MGQHDSIYTLANSHGDNLPPSNYYVCSPSAPAFIPQSPMTAPPPSHYPYLYHETYPQMAQPKASGNLPIYTSSFLSPPPMTHYVLNVDGTKVPVDTVPAAAKKAAVQPPPKQYPWWSVLLTFTFWISVGQVAIFVVSVVRGGIAPLSQNFNVGPPTTTLVDLGAKVAFLMRYNGEGWRFASAMFLHAGILHILLNLIAQVRLGIFLEREWGRMKFLVVYLVSGLGSTLMSCLLQPDTISVGASGAILGMVGGYFATIILIWKTLDPKSKKIQVIQALFIALVIGLLALAPHIDSSAHLGGIVTGFLLGFALLPSKLHTKYAYPIRVVAVFLVTVYFTVGFWYFFTKEKPPVFAV